MVMSIFSAFWQTRRLLKSVPPDICILFGGYVSLTVLLNCKITGIPVILHEQNAHAGRVTRLAAKINAPVMSGWDECDPLEKGCFKNVGVPIAAHPVCFDILAFRLEYFTDREGDV